MDLTTEQKKTFQPDYSYRRHPDSARNFVITRRGEDDSYDPVGEYILLDESEPADITEKKVMNLISLLNGSKNIVSLGERTQTRLLFRRVPKKDPGDKTEIVFTTLGTEGVSKDNARLTLEPGIIEDDHR